MRQQQQMLAAQAAAAQQGYSSDEGSRGRGRSVSSVSTGGSGGGSPSYELHHSHAEYAHSVPRRGAQVGGAQWEGQVQMGLSGQFAVMM
jgi:hypothetical protein